MSRILLVDDCKEVYTMVKQTTEQIAELIWAKSLREAHSELSERTFDLLILDVELPDGNGIEFCSNLHSTNKDIAVFFLTDHVSLAEKVMGFSAGADDYISKPISQLELRARLESRLRKSKHHSHSNDKYKWKELQINKGRQEVLITDNGTEHKVDLTALEFKILVYFAIHPGIVIPRDQILNDIWGQDIHIYQRSVDTHVSKLRKKLGVISRIVESIHGCGYKFNPTKFDI